jgi:ADP-ribose pyrophosphatase YjhB (NUDIX family)
MASDDRCVVRQLVGSVDPVDSQEHADQGDVLAWIDSGAPLYRLQPPALPAKHLTVHCALLDEDRRQILLEDHVRAGRWVLPGGHVDPGESPLAAAVRAAQELAVIARPQPDPLFIAVTRVQGAHIHIDVALWFVLRTDRDAVSRPGLGWFGLDGPIQWDDRAFDAQLRRFASKLVIVLDRQGALTAVP